MIRIGDDAIISFIFDFVQDKQKPCYDLGLCYTKVYCNSNLIWDIEWTSVDILEFLGKKLRFIMTEEVTDIFKGFINNKDKPFDFKKNSPIGNELFDEIFFKFLMNHDLSMGMKGTFLPPICLVKNESKMWIYANDIIFCTDFNIVIKILTDVGMFLYTNILKLSHPRSKYACYCWHCWQQSKTLEEKKK